MVYCHGRWAGPRSAKLVQTPLLPSNGIIHKGYDIDFDGEPVLAELVANSPCSSILLSPVFFVSWFHHVFSFSTHLESTWFKTRNSGGCGETRFLCTLRCACVLRWKFRLKRLCLLKCTMILICSHKTWFQVKTFSGHSKGQMPSTVKFEHVSHVMSAFIKFPNLLWKCHGFHSPHHSRWAGPRSAKLVQTPLVPDNGIIHEGIRWSWHWLWRWKVEDLWHMGVKSLEHRKSDMFTSQIRSWDLENTEHLPIELTRPNQRSNGHHTVLQARNSIPSIVVPDAHGD